MIRRAPVFRWSLTGDGPLRRRIPVRVGELIQEASRWEFLYDPQYLAMGADAWELDPSDIRTKQRSAYTAVGVVPPPVFCDVALSGWSEEILKRKRRDFLGSAAASEPWGWWEKLIYAPADGFGALFVGELDDKPPVEKVLADAVGPGLVQTLETVLLESSSGALGGERPKIAAFHRSAAGQAMVPVVLKFAHPSERRDSVVAEATALSLASELGLTVPAHHIESFDGLAALCIARFDREARMVGSAFHCVSAATALRLTPGTDREDPRRSYVALRSKLRQPGDALELYRRIVLNAAVGNSDDHPWNTSLRQVGLGTWQLSPLYDVMPFFQRAATPAFSMDIRRRSNSRRLDVRLATPANLVAAGREIAGLEPQEAQACIDKIFGHVAERWRLVFEKHAQRVPGVHAMDWAHVFVPAQVH